MISRKKSFGLIALLLLVVLQSWFAYLNVRYPYLGIDLSPTEQNQWVVSSMAREPGGIDVREGDIIFKVNGYDPDLHTVVAKWRSVEQADRIEVIRNGEHLVLSTEDVRNSLRYDILPIMAEFLCFAAAVVLYVKVRGSKSSHYLAATFAIIGLTFMGLGSSIRGDTIGKFVVLFSLSLIPVAFFHFLVVFFKEKTGLILKKRGIFVLYVLIAIESFIWLTWLGKDHINFLSYRINASLTLLTFILGMIIDIGHLFYIYFKHRTEQSSLSSIIRFVITSIIVSFIPVIFFSFIPKLIIGKYLISAYMTSWFILVFPLAFAYLIITKQIYDIHMVLRRLMFAVLIAFLPSLIVTAINIALFHEEISIRKYLVQFLFSLAVLSFVLYSAEHMYTRLERFMFPRKHVLQTALKRIAKDLTSTSSFHELKDLILVDIVNTLQVYGGAIVFKYKDSMEMITEGTINRASVEALVHSTETNGSLDLIAFEINRHEEYTSYLVMTHKRSNTQLVLEEVQWLNLIVSYLAVSLENVYLIRKLTDKLNQMASPHPEDKETQDMNWFRKLTFELQERERMRIANDMHDTTMQDLFQLKRKLAALSKIHGLPEEAGGVVQRLVDYVEIINVNLRQNCFDLNPHLLHTVGLIKTIEKIIERDKHTSPFEVRFDAPGAYAIERRGLETKRHLFRIIQELLNNAAKHSEAKLVTIRLAMINGEFHLLYEDDGVGFDPDQVKSSDLRVSGVGLMQMRSRILYLQGQMIIDAKRGAGVRMAISFPLQEGISA